MANIPLGVLEEPETRKPSKVRVVLFILVVVLFLLSITFIALYVGKNSETNDPSSDICSSRACTTTAADILNKLNESTKPCDDFYEFSCGGFLKKTHLPETYPYGIKSTFTELSEIVQYSFKALLEDKQLMSKFSEDSAVHKAFVFYKSCMNDAKISNDGIKPILGVIEQFGSWNITNKNWSEADWKLEKILARTMFNLSTGTFLSVNIMSSFFNNSKQFITISAGKSGFQRITLDKILPETTPWKQNLNVKGFDTNKDRYKKFMSTIFNLLVAKDKEGNSISGDNSNIDEEVNRIVDLEREFIEVVKYINLRNITELKNNIKFMTIDELMKLTSFQFDWKAYFYEGTGKTIDANLKFMVLNPDNIKSIVQWLTEKPSSLLANEIIWDVIRSLIQTLPPPFRSAQAIYVKASHPRWRICSFLTDNIAFTFATTLLYVEKHLSQSATETAAEMFTEIKDQFISGLKEQTWMDAATREQAKLKLQKMKDVIGFPSFIKNAKVLNGYYSNFFVNESHFLQSYLNVVKARILNKIKRFRWKVDKMRSTISFLATNAFYHPQQNSITMLAGILNDPFYKDGRLNALNYGSLGMVVGHEITHGFDKSGSEYDENGNIREWWTKESRDNFRKRSKCMIDQYNKVKIYGLQVNGIKTLSENIADNGGLKFAFRAYQKWRKANGNEKTLPALSKFTNNQLFFISFAQTWCAKYKSVEHLKAKMKTDTHSPNPARVRVTLHNSPEFREAFGCPAPKNTCAVW